MDYKSMGMIVGFERKRQGLSLEELGKAIGLSKSSVDRLEHGQISDEDIYNAAAKVLGFALEDKLLQDDDADHKQLILLHESDLSPITGDLKERLSDRSCTNLQYEAFLKVQRAKVFLFEGKLSEAIKEGKKAIRYIEKHKPGLKTTNFLPYVFNVVSFAKYLSNDLPGALVEINAAISTFDEYGKNLKLFYQIRINRCIYLEKMDRLLEAHDDIEYLFSVHKEITNLEVLLKVWGLKALLERMKGNTILAIHIAQKGLELARENKKYDQHCWITSLIAKIYCDLGKPEKSEGYFQLALSYQDKLSNPTLSAETLIQFALFYTKSDRTTEAKCLLEKALSICQVNKYTGFRYLHALMNLGSYYIDNYEPEQAEKHLKTAFDLSEHGTETQKKIILLLSRCYQQTDQDKYLEFSKQYITLQKSEESKLW